MQYAIKLYFYMSRGISALNFEPGSKRLIVKMRRQHAKYTARVTFAYSHVRWLIIVLPGFISQQGFHSIFSSAKLEFPLCV